MMDDEWTPYDKPETLIDRIMFPSMRLAYEHGFNAGYYKAKHEGVEL